MLFPVVLQWFHVRRLCFEWSVQLKPVLALWSTYHVQLTRSFRLDIKWSERYAQAPVIGLLKFLIALVCYFPLRLSHIASSHRHVDWSRIIGLLSNAKIVWWKICMITCNIVTTPLQKYTMGYPWKSHGISWRKHGHHVKTMGFLWGYWTWVAYMGHIV